MDIALTTRHRRYIENKVKSGAYGSHAGAVSTEQLAQMVGL